MTLRGKLLEKAKQGGKVKKLKKQLKAEIEINVNRR